MKLNELRHRPGAKTKKMCVGRGIGSGKGKTAGRGVKGQKARTGVSGVRGFEGGQTPLYRRLPKIGFSNTQFADRYTELSLDTLQAAIDSKLIDAKKPMNEDALVAGKVIRRKRDGVKILGGSIKAKVDVTVSKITKSAKDAIEKAGGSVTLIVIERKPVKREKRGAKAA